MMQLLVSLPAELLGLTLALIEIRFPPIADYFRSSILGTGEDLNHGVMDDVRRKPGRWEIALSLVGYAIMFPFFLYFGWLILGRHGGEATAIFGTGIVALFVLSSLLFYVIRPVLRLVLQLISGFAPQREIGTLGLFITMIGITSEVLQASVLLGLQIESIDAVRQAVGLCVFGLALVLAIGYVLLMRSLIGYFRNRRIQDT